MNRIPDVIVDPATASVQVGDQVVLASYITTELDEGCLYATITFPVRSVTCKPADK